MPSTSLESALDDLTSITGGNQSEINYAYYKLHSAASRLFATEDKSLTSPDTLGGWQNDQLSSDFVIKVNNLSDEITRLATDMEGAGSSTRWLSKKGADHYLNSIAREFEKNKKEFDKLFTNVLAYSTWSEELTRWGLTILTCQNSP
ncbi:uncharacterized protein I303_102309 [Kwoniella dejecticola CBS 10117]|uniref:Uncharacterized protein n=1 Tax=Kwoniella dejecticola CBS 10117 TaxID=1296121 RepID=A0A1A6ABC1_9TREE|nr:uncharacterized protein I303_01551 [Kwoniella dejecticola CBS 10117]OBR87349.1 hypothetical protein I303_01551 [Kwoniella dejecticola CBS 10117]